MHVPDGILPGGVCTAGYLGTALLSGLSVRTIRRAGNTSKRLPNAVALTAVFIVATWIRHPMPPGSIHFVLGGFMGVLLGWLAFPSILAGLLVQAAAAGHGGLAALGVNAVITGLPAMLAAWLFSTSRDMDSTSTGVLAFVAGSGSVLLSTLMMYLVLSSAAVTLPAQTEYQGLRTLALAYIPIALFEGVLTAVTVTLMRKNGRDKPGI